MAVDGDATGSGRIRPPGSVGTGCGTSLNPEIVLLFKAKHAREKDQQDFDANLSVLNARPARLAAGMAGRH